jgi:GT2 family glycosyltransferase
VERGQEGGLVTFTRTLARVAGLVVDWSTPADLDVLIKSAMTHDPDMYWMVWKNFHPQFANQFYSFQDIYNPEFWSVIWSDANRGHGYGINRAAIRAQELWNPEYYFIVNPDCEFRVPIIEDMILFLEEDPDRWIVGPKQLDSKMRITAAGIFGTDIKPKHRFWRMPDPKNTLARDAQQAIMAAGSAFMIRASHFQFLGGMLEAKHYYSDTWLSYHARAHGGQVWYYGKPWLIHEWHRSSPVGFDGTDGNFIPDKKLFQAKCREHDPPIVCE